MSNRLLVASETGTTVGESFATAELDLYAAELEPATTRSPRVRWATLVAVIVAVGLGIWTWDTVKYRFIPKRFGVVVPGELYRSGQLSKWQFEPTVRAHQIAAVMDLNGVDPADEHQAAEIASAKALGLAHYRFPLSGDGTGSVKTYVTAIETLARLQRQGKPVLVHCHAGAQRTGSVIAAYRVLVLGQDPHEAYAELGRYGWNAEQDQAMLMYLNGNLRHVAEQLVADGVIAAVPNPIPVVGP